MPPWEAGAGITYAGAPELRSSVSCMAPPLDLMDHTGRDWASELKENGRFYGFLRIYGFEGACGA